MAYHAVIRVPGESWDPSLALREQKRWDEHAAFMDALAEEGFVVLGGPVGDGTRFLLIIDAESQEDIVARLADDPWAPMGLLTIASIEPWEVLLRKPRQTGPS